MATETLEGEVVETFEHKAEPEAFEVRTLTTEKGMQVETTMTDAEAIDILAHKEKPTEFERNLVRDHRLYGARFSHNKMAWVHKLALEQLAREMGDVPPAGEVPTGAYAKLVEFLARPKSELVWPKITMKLPSGAVIELKLNNKPGRRFYGDITVSSGPRSKGGTWYGAIKSDGTFKPSYNPLSTEQLDVLAEFMADPAKTASKYGRKSGHCCFCNLALTDATSVSVGYGAACAKAYGLPHSASYARQIEREFGEKS